MVPAAAAFSVSVVSRTTVAVTDSRSRGTSVFAVSTQPSSPGASQASARRR